MGRILEPKGIGVCSTAVSVCVAMQHLTEPASACIMCHIFWWISASSFLRCLSSSTCTSISCSSLQHTMSSKTLPADIPKFGEIRPWLHRLAKEGLIEIKDVAILAEPAPPELSHGAMTDAPKRAKLDHAEWVFPSQAACAAASGGDIKKDGYTAKSVSPELPPGVTSLEQWGSTVCTLPKIKDRNLCYTEILASKENMILDYMSLGSTTIAPRVPRPKTLRSTWMQ